VSRVIPAIPALVNLVIPVNRATLVQVVTRASQEVILVTQVILVSVVHRVTQVEIQAIQVSRAIPALVNLVIPVNRATVVSQVIRAIAHLVTVASRAIPVILASPVIQVIQE